MHVRPAHADAGTASLRTRFGIGAAETLGASDSLAERLRGLERLGAVGTPRAVQRLVRALEPGGSAKAPEERLVAVRQLSLHADDPSARRALARVLAGHFAPSTDALSALDDLAERTAALALSRSEQPDALTALGKALESPGRAAAAAEAALVAHPPRDLDAVLAAARLPSLSLAHALDELADQRGFDTLRDVVRLGTPDVRAAAAIALTRLGDFETVELSRQWLVPGAPAVLRVAAARILAMAHAQGAARAIGALLRDPATADAALDLALEAPNPALVPELSHLLRDGAGDRAEDVVVAIGRAGGDGAVRQLTPLLDDAALAPAAAYELARMPGDAAARAIEALLLRPSTQRLAARAATARAFLLDDAPPRLESTLDAMYRSRDAADRAVAAVGLSVLDPDRVLSFVRSADEAVVRAAASCLLLAPKETAAYVAERLLGSARGDTQTALALSLAVPGASEHATTGTLLALVDSGGAAAPLAALALGERDRPTERPRLDELLASSDPAIRAHVALGLAASKESDAAGRLEAAYRLETNATVRAAIVHALAARTEPSRARVLALAAAFDPDPDVRASALMTTGGHATFALARGRALAWIPVVESASGRPAEATVGVEEPGGLLLPAASAPDGVVMVSGLAPGPVVLRVAPARDPGNASKER
ncbi:MAG TPA: HEAT repeat domain-containing protein [Polyangiaceae bacterium]|nr:HEAT repeat domain-containing protein [Polyangiaceae bacterium]